jgi:hypothetical protein
MGTQRDVGGREDRYRRKKELEGREEEMGRAKIQRRDGRWADGEKMNRHVR